MRDIAALVEKLYDANTEELYGYAAVQLGQLIGDACEAMETQADRIAELERENAALKVDANRARFLREHPEDFVVSMNIGFDWVSVRGEDFVEELDAAIAKEGE